MPVPIALEEKCYKLISYAFILLVFLPDGLVGDDNLGPLVLAQDLGGSVELAGDDLDGLVGLTLLYICKRSGVSGDSS